MPPLVSVIIPVRNYEQYIGEAIESVLAQEFKDWELIVVDDYSTDRTGEIAARYQKDEKVRLVRNDRNLGQFQTHNRGAEFASGKYLKFFHGDDVMYPHFLRTMVDGMEAYPRAALGISHPRRLWTAPHLFSPEEVWRAQTDRLTSILSEGPSGTIFRADAFRQVGGFGTRFHTSDSEMNYRMAMDHPILLQADGLWWYRIHEAQIVRAYGMDQHSAETVIWFRELLADPRNPLTLQERAGLDREMIRNHCRLVLRRLNEGSVRAALQLWRQGRLSLQALPTAFARSRDAASPRRPFPGRLGMKLRRVAFSAVYHARYSHLLLRRAAHNPCYCVLAYHGVSENPLPYFTSTRLFEKHLRFFRSTGQLATMDELAAFLSGASVPEGPNLRYVLTFNDGYGSIIRNAVPLLRQYQVPAMVYLNPAWIEKREVPWVFWLVGDEKPAPELRRSLAWAGFGNYPRLADAEADAWPSRLVDGILKQVPQEDFGVWWSRVAEGFPVAVSKKRSEAQTASWEELASARDILNFGSHTLSHSILGLCRDPGFIRNEVLRSKKVIEERLGQPCPHFAYPRGQQTDFNEQTQRLLAEVGHRTAVTTTERFAVACDNPFEIPRFFVGETPVAALAAQLTGVAQAWDRNVKKLKTLLGKSRK